MGGDDLQWIKSSYSGGSGTECVEIARLSARTAIRDSKDPVARQLVVPAQAWGVFIGAVRENCLG
ncbi:DUF397 domain-containing protein [Streptomyces sp. HNM0663]|uniref:DUF397 domain-containing protein n=1 Tax=Streptomyces chengmaiensis TaxID=3040919 RepID=A0ABT6HQ74_9ACTN|nr:DUF397 domain-containing protein [Streptomyces chengmaiensis]MDH2390490.1 DUF397 domain-containing protein [Streptomyces chengmaiensis]